MSLLEVWKLLLHARQHMIQPHSIEATMILWEAEGAVIQERVPYYTNIQRRLSCPTSGKGGTQPDELCGHSSSSV